MDRITSKTLEQLIVVLNNQTGHPQEPYQKERDETGRLRPNTGTYCLSGAYGGWNLDQMCEGGGVHTVFNCGHIPARDLYNRIRAYMDGLEAANSSK